MKSPSASRLNRRGARRRTLSVILGTLVLLGLVGVSALWWTGMHTGSEHGCIAAGIQSETCPEGATPAAVVFHLKAFRSFSAVLQQSGQWSGLLLGLALALFAVARLTVMSNHARSTVVRRDDASTAGPSTQHLHWLSLFEHSPSLAIGRASLSRF